MYADDNQLLISFKPEDTEKVNTLHNCLSAIKNWMNDSFLQIDTDKTKVLLIASDSIATKAVKCIRSLSSLVKSNLKNLGVFFDMTALFNHHIKLLTCSCFFHLIIFSHNVQIFLVKLFFIFKMPDVFF